MKKSLDLMASIIFLSHTRVMFCLQGFSGFIGHIASVKLLEAEYGAKVYNEELLKLFPYLK